MHRPLDSLPGRPLGRRRRRLLLLVLGSGMLISALSAAARGQSPTNPSEEAPPPGSEAISPAPEYLQPMQGDMVSPRRTPSAQMVDTSLAPQDIGVQCERLDKCGRRGWTATGSIPWGVFAQGEYIGPARQAHVRVYRLRVDDTLDFVYRLTRGQTSQAYRLGVGDQIRVESATTPRLNQPEVIAPPDVIGLIIQPDGTVSLRLLGEVKAAGLTVDQFQRDVEERYKKYARDPSITIVPYTFNLRLKDIRDSVDRRYGSGGQAQPARVTPEGSVQLPGIGSVPVQGLTLDELKREVDRRYADAFGEGLEVTPILTARAPRFVYVVGEVKTPGRYTLEAPTTLVQSIALAGGWNVGANLNHVVVFRRDENWRLMAAKINIRGALFGKQANPGGEIWLRDSDIVVIPKSPIRELDDAIQLLFTQGLYGIVPLNFTVNFAKLSTI